MVSKRDESCLPRTVLLEFQSPLLSLLQGQGTVVYVRNGSM